jgi:hypothetical protein
MFRSSPPPAVCSQTLDVQNQPGCLRLPEIFPSPTLALRPVLHSFHNLSTIDLKEEEVVPRKTLTTRDLSAQLLSQFIDEPVQIFIGLSLLINFLDRMQNCGVVLTSKLASDLGQ